ncbi:phytyl ester synthase 2, chloroplastic isoform X1 [Brassica napus]|uniref:phytyl ester synthase 2, chloroplastic isoform X1 n=1 Tax=Brassica napus TaxID=3708 RepID=UPI0020788F28|nr:phytyl ester synthase 2, chloroplastic isoform X1 [Brassica napus]
MKGTVVLGSINGLSSVSSLSRETFRNAGFFCWKQSSSSKYRLTAIRLESSTTTHGGIRRIRKNQDEKVVESPYANVEEERPDSRKSLLDFLEEVRDFVGEEGPPRWFSPLESAAQAQGSPLLLFIPGMDGTGLGLIRQHKKLGELFDIWCLHIPARDRTSAKDLVKLIEETVKSENYLFPDRPIYLVGESIGACLALEVAGRNPNIDLALILANPATLVNNFMSQPLSGMLNVLPDEIPTLLEDIFGFKQGFHYTGGPLTETLDAFSNEFAVHQIGGMMLRDLFAVSANLPSLSRIFSKDTLLWKLEMLKSAVASAKSNTYAVRAELLILLSGRDQWLLNMGDINRLSRTLPNCIVRKFNDSGPFLLLEDDVDLVTILKCTCFYRRGRSHDYISDYIMPTPYELRKQLEEHRLLIYATSPVMLSTLENGKIVRSLEGLPTEGPVLYVGYHMVLGFELPPMIAQLMKERNIHLRGLTHPIIFMNKSIVHDIIDPQTFDKYKITGGVPVSHANIYKLLSSKSHVLLYPGGVREALHRKGEEYKLFWPEQPEFVRVASKFGAKIVPFGVVGEDDICKIVLDSNDQRNIPILKYLMERATKEAGNLRKGHESELGNQDFHLPGLVPKIPGRFYYYFGKPIDTAGKEQELRDKEKAQELYLQVKSQVEQCIAYLKVKRESDPYRNLLPRMLYQASHGFSSDIPTFDL